jgi:hypothetical protein
MAAPSVIAKRQEETLRRIKEIVERHHPEAQRRLDVYTPVPGGVPNSIKMSNEYALFVAESMQMFAELLDPILEDRKPRRRGRPPKQRKDDRSDAT